MLLSCPNCCSLRKNKQINKTPSKRYKRTWSPSSQQILTIPAQRQVLTVGGHKKFFIYTCIYRYQSIQGHSWRKPMSGENTDLFDTVSTVISPPFISSSGITHVYYCIYTFRDKQESRSTQSALLSNLSYISKETELFRSYQPRWQPATHSLSMMAHSPFRAECILLTICITFLLKNLSISF